MSKNRKRGNVNSSKTYTQVLREMFAEARGKGGKNMATLIVDRDDFETAADSYRYGDSEKAEHIMRQYFTGSFEITGIKKFKNTVHVTYVETF